MLKFEWDSAKNRSNQKKHRVDFETAQLVFEDPMCITFVERIVDWEQRWHAIGSVEGAIILVVVHTYREKPSDDVIRIISARQATSHERKLYAKAIHC
jgi:hypothetical protein